jgi:hypothetical protein
MPSPIIFRISACCSFRRGTPPADRDDDGRARDGEPARAAFLPGLFLRPCPEAAEPVVFADEFVD